MARQPKPMQTLKIAFLGARGSGKTTLLTSYLGHMASSRWQQEHQYYMTTPDSADSKRLHALFEGLRAGYFPEATIRRATAYRLHMHVQGCAGTPLEIQWLDYPGEWWDREPEDAKERRQRDECLGRLVNSHVCFLVIDGAELRKHGEKYLRAHLAHMSNEIANQLRHAARRRKPRQKVVWILALSKADIYGADVRADDFADYVRKHAGDQLETLRQRLAESGHATLGMNYLLFSSVLGQGQRIIDIHRTIGLDLIAPLALYGLLEQALRRIEKSAVLKRIFAGSADRGALEAVFGRLRQWLAKWPDRGTRELADILFNRAESWIGARVSELQTDLDQQRQQGLTMQAATTILKLALNKPQNRAYYVTAHLPEEPRASTR